MNDKDLKVFNIIKKHIYNDGWSNGYSVNFFEMSEQEMDTIHNYFKNIAKRKVGGK